MQWKSDFSSIALLLHIIIKTTLLSPPSYLIKDPESEDVLLVTRELIAPCVLVNFIFNCIFNGSGGIATCRPGLTDVGLGC